VKGKIRHRNYRISLYTSARDEIICIRYFHTHWAKSLKNSLKECVFVNLALKITVFSAILTIGFFKRLLKQLSDPFESLDPDIFRIEFKFSKN